MHLDVAWLGVPEGKKYHRYRIRFADGRAKRVDWGKFGAGEGDAPDLRAVEPSPTNVEAIEPDADEDVPF
jgi:hypothetical protein